MRAPAAIEKAHAMLTQENILARYKVLHELGRGATGAVYAARDRETGAVVALKRLDPALLSKSDANFADRFLKHARSARHLRHRNIVTIHDAGEAGGTVYVAMEMLEGESLRTLLDRGPLPIARAIRIAHEVASGLAHAHLEGVVHGGIKPSNIIVSPSGAVKITDFGIGQPGGSPEQARGDPVDHRCDIFSLGAVFYEMLTRRRPFEGGSPQEFTPPPPPSELNPHVPRALDALVLSMLAAQPAARMAGLPVLLPELQRLEEALGLGAGVVPDREHSRDASPGAAEPAASVPPAAPEPAPRAPEPKPAPRTPEPTLRTPAPSAADEVQQVIDRKMHEYIAMMERESRLQRSPRSGPSVVAALALVLAVLGIGLTGFVAATSPMGVAGYVDYWSERIERVIAASRMQEAPATPPVASRPTAPPPVAEAPKDPVRAREDKALEEALTAPVLDPRKLEPVGAPVAQAPKVEPVPVPAPIAQAPQEPVTAPPAPQASPPPAATKPSPLEELERLVASAPELESLLSKPEKPASGRAAPAKQLPQAAQSPAKVPARKPSGTAMLILAVSPGGELYIDGERHGTTPPLTTLDLEPGLHRVEVRHGSRKPYVTYMTVEPGDVRRIRHDFDAKGSRPPS
jgi:hypothetical protein